MENRTIYLSDIFGCLFFCLKQALVIFPTYNGFFMLIRKYDVHPVAEVVLGGWLALSLGFVLVKDPGGLIGLIAKATIVPFAVVGGIGLILNL